MQRTSFRFFVLVIDDASTDGTIDIIKSYAAKYPDKVAALIAKENTFGRKGRAEAYKKIIEQYASKAKYIATCEGDDFWTDSDKLQIQYDYMEKNPQCSMYLHNSIWFDCETLEKKAANPFDVDSERDLEFDEVICIKRGHPATASRLYRKELLHAPEYVRNCSVGDYNLMLYAMTQGKVHYSSRVMSLYRFKSVNSTTQRLIDRENRDYPFYHSIGLIAFLMTFDARTLFLHHRSVAAKVRFFFDLLVPLINEGEEIVQIWEEVKNNYYLDLDLDLLTLISNKYKQENEVDYISPELNNFLESHKSIVIFGAGNYAMKMSDKLKKNGISYEAHIVSNAEEGQTFEDKPVYSVRDMPFDPRKIGVIIAVTAKSQDGVFDVIETNGLEDCIYPYDFKLLDEAQDI